MRYYTPGDDIFFFGFSRGAYTARFLAEMLDHVGLLSVRLRDPVLIFVADSPRLEMKKCAISHGSRLYLFSTCIQLTDDAGRSRSGSAVSKAMTKRRRRRGNSSNSCVHSGRHSADRSALSASSVSSIQSTACRTLKMRGCSAAGSPTLHEARHTL